MSYLTDQLAKMRAEIAALKRDRVAYREAQVVAVDPVASAFTAEVPGTTPLAGVAAPAQFLPEVGDTVRLSLYGATAVYEPGTIAADAVGTRELTPAVVADLDAGVNAAGAAATAQQQAADALAASEAADTAAAQAAADADVALTTANGKNRVTYSLSTPSGSGTRVGDTWFQRYPGQANVPLPIIRVGSSAWVAPASSTAVAPTYPTGLAEGDQVYAVLAIKPDTATVATPANWTLVGASAALGAGTQGAGTGATKVHVYRRAVPAGGLTGSQSFTITGGSAPVAHMRAFRADTAGTTGTVTWSNAFSSFSRTTAIADIDGTTTAAIAGQASDEYVMVTATPAATANAVLISAISEAGLTFDTVTQIPAGTITSTQGNDISAAAAQTKVTAGSGSAVVVVSGGMNVASTSGTMVFRVRATATTPATNEVVAAWEWDGDSWEPRVFDDAMFATISAAKITSGTLDVGSKITVGDPATLYTDIGGTGVAAYRVENGVTRRVGVLGESIGGANWFVDPAGVGNLQALNVVGDAMFKGFALDDLLSRRARVVARTENWANPGTTTTQLGMVELAFQSTPGHMYGVVATGMVADVPGLNGGNMSATPPVEHEEATVWWYARYTTDGSAPTISSPVMARTKSLIRYSSFPWENLPAHLEGDWVETSATPRTIRVGLSMAKPTGGTGVFMREGTDEPRSFKIVDLGLAPSDTGQPNGMAGTSISGTVPPPPNTLQEDETIYDASWGRIFTGDGQIYVEGSNGMQGQSLYAPYGNMRTFVGFPDMTPTMAGATIRWIKLYTYWNWWAYDDGGHPVVSTHGHTVVPATNTGQYGNGFAYQGGYVGINAGVWIDLPSSWFADFQNGTFRGVVLGPGPTADLRFHGKFDGPGGGNPPRIAIGWRK